MLQRLGLLVLRRPNKQPSSKLGQTFAGDGGELGGLQRAVELLQHEGHGPAEGGTVGRVGPQRLGESLAVLHPFQGEIAHRAGGRPEGNQIDCQC